MMLAHMSLLGILTLAARTILKQRYRPLLAYVVRRWRR